MSKYRQYVLLLRQKARVRQTDIHNYDPQDRASTAASSGKMAGAGGDGVGSGVTLTETGLSGEQKFCRSSSDHAHVMNEIACLETLLTFSASERSVTIFPTCIVRNKLQVYRNPCRVGIY